MFSRLLTFSFRHVKRVRISRDLPLKNQARYRPRPSVHFQLCSAFSTENKAAGQGDPEPPKVNEESEEKKADGEVTNEENKSKKQSFFTGAASVAGGAYLVLGKGGKFLALLKVLKLTKLMPLASILLSTVTYSIFFGPAYAAGLVGLIFVHELGHALALKQLKYDVGPMVFVPFMGASTLLKDQPKTAYDEAYMSMAGPVMGTLGAMVPFVYGMTTGSQFALGLSEFGFFINMLNLAPFGSLDGGRVAPCINRWLFPLGLVGATYYFATYHVFPLFYLFYLFGVYETYNRFFNLNENPPGFMEITQAQRALVTISYFGLIILLFGLHQINSAHKMSLNEIKKQEKLLVSGSVDSFGTVSLSIPEKHWRFSDPYKTLEESEQDSNTRIRYDLSSQGNFGDEVPVDGSQDLRAFGEVLQCPLTGASFDGKSRTTEITLSAYNQYLKPGLVFRAYSDGEMVLRGLNDYDVEAEEFRPFFTFWAETFIRLDTVFGSEMNFNECKVANNGDESISFHLV